MRIARKLALITLSTLVAAPLLALPEGVVQGTVDCGKRCHKILVYLDGVEGSFNGDNVVVSFDQEGKVFVPHILPIVKGTTVRIFNSDPFLHNVHAYDGKLGLFNLGIPPKANAVDKVFKQTGSYTILCDVHPEMSAYIVVLDNPFFSTLNPDGTFEIAGVPPGNYTAVLYHPERDKQVKQVIEVGEAPTRVEFLAAKKNHKKSRRDATPSEPSN